MEKPSKSQYIVKKSKFISNVLPIKDTKEAEDHIENFRKNTGTQPIMFMPILWV